MMCKMSSEEEELESSNLCSKLQHNPWNVYLGDCSVVSQFLSNKPLLSLKWTPLHTINIFLRAVGQVSDSCVKIVLNYFLSQPAFVNNPLLGAIILAGIFLFDGVVGAGCVLGGITATLTDLLLGLHPLGDLNNGVVSFNGVLVGTVIPILFPVFYDVDRSPVLWSAIFVGAITR